MTPKLQLSQNVITRLGDVGRSSEGAVYGTMYNNSLLVLGMSIDPPESGATPFHHIQTHFPTEIDFCGIVIFTDDTDDQQLSPDNLDILKEVLVTDNPLVMKRALNSCTLKAYFYYNDKLVETQYEVLSESQICQRFVHVRLRTQLPLLCEPDPASILEAINNLQKKVSSGTVAFQVMKTKVYLFGTEMMESSIPVSELYESIRSTENKKKTDILLQNMEVLNVTMVQKATRDAQSEDTARLAPVIHHLKCDKRSVHAKLPIDHLALVHTERRVAELYNVLVDTLCRSLRIFERCLSHSHKRLSLPRAYHYLSPTLGHFFTIVYPTNKSDSDLESRRESLHRQLHLPMDRPVFRKGNVHVFREDIPANAPLVNPHEGLNQAVKGGELSIVYGLYSYHHYLQDGMQDDGWGCAYRSLQTVVSWFRHQGYTDRAVPTHREIQQCLVDIGDKPATFVGSHQWIGSTEVSFCLDTMLGVTSRILNVSSGAELADVGPDLSRHFATHGTPIMIGGGVLAHTILGVDYNRETGELRFLVLDPHYTGADDLRVIQQKGWVAWKKPDFWTKTAYYNLCMPLRPTCF